MYRYKIMLSSLFHEIDLGFSIYIFRPLYDHSMIPSTILLWLLQMSVPSVLWFIHTAEFLRISIRDKSQLRRFHSCFSTTNPFANHLSVEESRTHHDHRDWRRWRMIEIILVQFLNRYTNFINIYFWKCSSISNCFLRVNVAIGLVFSILIESNLHGQLFHQSSLGRLSPGRNCNKSSTATKEREEAICTKHIEIQSKWKEEVSVEWSLHDWIGGCRIFFKYECRP